MYMPLYLAAVLVGILFGIFVDMTIMRKRAIGILRVDTSDPDDKPYLFVELKDGPEKLKHNDYVTMKVSTKSYISQR